MSAATSLRRDAEPPEPPTRIGRRSRRVALVTALVVVLAVVFTWVIAFSSLLGVRSVEVHGAHTLTARAVQDAAHITAGTPLVRLDTAAITTRIERLADVESAQVRTSFPSSVIITVDERTPVGYIHRNGQDVYVDHTGDQYRAVASAPAGLPRFVVPSGVSARTTGGAVATVASALPASLRARVRSIEALNPQAITLVLDTGRIVRWGSADRSTDKARVLAVLLPRRGDIDVTDPDQPYLH